jgi:hypothetical protein
LSARLNAHLSKAALASDTHQMVDHCPPDPGPAYRFGRVHGLQLGVSVSQLPQSPNGEKLAVPAETEKRHSGVNQTVDLESVDFLGKAVRPCMGQMVAQELTNILSPGVFDADLVLGHTPKLRDSKRNSLRLLAGSPGSPGQPRGASSAEKWAIEGSE